MTMTKVLRTGTGILLLFSGVCTQADQSDLSSLLVYGEGFRFAVKEPPGWVGDTDRAAEFGANIIFYRRGQTPDTRGAPLIRILVAHKVDENTAEDLAHDMDEYRQRYPDTKFRDLEVKHTSYKPFSKLFYVPGKFYEYVTYLNPGAASTLLLSASMNKEGVEATQSEYSAYVEIIGSLHVL